MKIRTWHILLFVIALALFGAAGAPAAFFVRPSQDGALHFTGAVGTIWSGRLEGVRLVGYPVRSVSWRALPIELLRGQLAFALRFDGGVNGGATARRGLNDIGISAKTLHLVGAPLGSGMLSGDTTIRDLDVQFAGGACKHAVGQVSSDVMTKTAAQLQFQGPSLDGGVACDGKDAAVRVSGVDFDADRVEAELRLAPNGGATWRIAIETAKNEAKSALVANGFTVEGGNHLAKEGKLKWR